MSINTKMSELIVFYSYYGILYSNDNEQTTSTHKNMDASHKHNVAERNQTQRVYTV